MQAKLNINSNVVLVVSIKDIIEHLHTYTLALKWLRSENIVTIKQQLQKKTCSQIIFLFFKHWGLKVEEEEKNLYL